MKNTITELNSKTFFEKAIGAANYLNMGGGPGNMISLNPGTYKFPFQFTLPNNIPPSFEYPFRNRRASLRYTFTAELLSPYAKTLTESYIWIKARPINIPDQIKHENYVTVKNVGILSRGKSGVAIFTMANNYRINDMIPFTIDIYNEECGVQVKEVKISIKRTVTFVKAGKQYQHRTAILRKRYPCVCPKNTKTSFHYDDLQLRDNEFKDSDFNPALNPYPFIDDLNLLMPNMRSSLIKCEYSLKATSYFDLSVLGKDRPRVEMPIYITHQLQKEFEYEKSTNQYNGQGQEFANRDFQRGFSASCNNPFENNNNNFGNNNNNSSWGNNNNNFGNNNNNSSWGNNNNNNNLSNSTVSSSSVGSKKFSYEAYIASKKLNNPGQNNNNNNNNWGSKTTFQSSSNFRSNTWNNNSNNSNPWENNNNNNNWGNNNNNNWGNNNNNNSWGNNNNNNWGNNNNNNSWGNNNNNNWGNNNNNNSWGNNNNNNNNWGNNNNNGSANPFGGGNNDFPSLDKINSSMNNSNNPPNPFSNNNNNNPPPNPFGNNNNPPPNPFGNNNNNNPPPNPFGNNNNNPPNPFGNNSNPYQNSYPGF